MTERPLLTYRGQKPTPSMLVELWTNAEKRFGGTGGRTDRIKKADDLRHMIEKPRIDKDFLTSHPEVNPDTAISLLPERTSYESDLIAKAGAIEPEISREPLDVHDTAVDQAEEYEAYMREVALDPERGVPYQTSIEKFVEDGEHGATALPAELVCVGIPDFFDRLTERALAALDKDTRKEYTPDQNDRRGRYVRRNADGSRRYNPKYERDGKGRTRKDAEKADGKGSFKVDRSKTKMSHDAAVRRYLLQHAATSFRVIPALDCFPLLGRGSGRQRWKVEGLIERSLFTREELIDKKYGWKMLGSKLALPQGIRQSYGGSAGQFYLYTAYLMLQAEDDEDGVTAHPCVLYSVGGAGTWWDGWEGESDEAERDSVAIIDLYAERKIKTPRWYYDFGSHTSSNDPNYYGRPAIWPFRQRILNIEEMETSAHVTIQQTAYTGHYYKPDAALATAAPLAVVDGQNRLRQPKKPKPGGIEPWAGDVLPFAQAQIGRDHYLHLDGYKQSLAEGMAVDAIRGDTGHAMLVSASQGQISKRHVREAAQRVYRFWLECDALNRLSDFKCHGVKWPILTSKERPVGHEIRSRMQDVEFDPEWLGEDENPKLNVEYGEEFNLAKADLEMNAAERGYRALKHVAKAFGETDEMNLRFEIAKDQMWKDPENMILLRGMVDAKRGMARQRKAALLQAQERLTKAGIEGVPGAESGMPTAMLRRGGGGQGQPQPSGGGTNVAAASRGGIEGAQQQGDKMALQATASAGGGV